MTKNSNDTGDGALVDKSDDTPYQLILSNEDEDREVKQVIIISSGTNDRGFKELLRYKVTAPESGSIWVLGQVFSPVFFDSSKPA